MKDFLGRGFHLYMDNYFTGIELTRIILINKTFLSGTLRSNRIGIPITLINLPVNKKFSKTIVLDKNIRITKYNDKKVFYQISSFYRNTKITKCRWNGEHKRIPLVVHRFNKNMLGIDKGDQLNSYSTNSRKCSRWLFVKTGLELMLGTVVSNCYIKYKQEFGYKGTITDFRKALIEEKIKKLLPDYRHNSNKQTGNINKIEVLSEHRFVMRMDKKLLNCKFCHDKFQKIYRNTSLSNYIKKNKVLLS